MVLTLPERCEFRWGHGYQGEGMQSEVPMECAVGAGPWGGLSQEEAFGLSSSSPGKGGVHSSQGHGPGSGLLPQLTGPTCKALAQHLKGGSKGSQASAATLRCHS